MDLCCYTTDTCCSFCRTLLYLLIVVVWVLLHLLYNLSIRFCFLWYLSWYLRVMPNFCWLLLSCVDCWCSYCGIYLVTYGSCPIVVDCSWLPSCCIEICSFHVTAVGVCFIHCCSFCRTLLYLLIVRVMDMLLWLFHLLACYCCVCLNWPAAVIPYSWLQPCWQSRVDLFGCLGSRCCPFHL